MENVMQGIIDMHIHAAPDVRARKLDDLELMEASVQRGVRAIVLQVPQRPHCRPCLSGQPRGS